MAGISVQRERRSAPRRRPTAAADAIDATGNLRDTRVLQVFHRRCERALGSGRRHLAVDLANVTRADTRLVATLITLLRIAQIEGVLLQLTVSDLVYHWIVLCHAEGLLQPACAQQRTGGSPRGTV